MKFINYVFFDEEYDNKLINIKKDLNEDLIFFLKSDPALNNKEEIIYYNQGFLAVICYRLANYYLNNDEYLLAKKISNYAYSKTSIDINPKASIGVPFFIDHGCGCVIGETAKIGNNVKIYHGVTLGALSVTKENNKKRHPTIGNNVTIYANATILGNINVGDNSLIGANCFIFKSIKANKKVYYKSKMVIKKRILKKD